jgi:tetratricopeptide (TPR) repeat protein
LIFFPKEEAMRKVAFLLMLAALFTTALQAVNITELESQLPNTKGRERIMILAQMTETLLRSDPQKAISCGKEALQILGRFKDKETELAVLDQIARASFSLGDYGKALEYYNNSHVM